MGKIVENYSLQETIGAGSYGKVYRATHIITHEQFAVKVIKAERFRQQPKLEEYTVNEIKTLSSLGASDHIVRYIDMLKTTNNYYFVYEYCNQGTLRSLIDSYQRENGNGSGTMPIAKALKYFDQLLEAFKVLTRNHIMHRDLKPQNILLHNEVLKVADFGFCKSLERVTDTSQTMLGSPIYMAPEVIKGEAYTMKADIWSIGIVFYELLFGFCPFNSSSIAKLIQTLETQELKFPFPTSASIEKLLRKMLTKDPSKRIDWEELFSYRFQDASIERERSPSIRQSGSRSIYQRTPLTHWNPQKTHTNHVLSLDDGNSLELKTTTSKLDKSSPTPSRMEKDSWKKENSMVSSSFKGSSSKLQAGYLADHATLCQLARLSACIFREFGQSALPVVTQLQQQIESLFVQMLARAKRQHQRNKFISVLESELESLRQIQSITGRKKNTCLAESRNFISSTLSSRNISSDGRKFLLRAMDILDSHVERRSSNYQPINEGQLIAEKQCRLDHSKSTVI